MKCNALAKVLETYATQLPPSRADEWANVARLFNSAKSKMVGDFCQELAELADLASAGPRGGWGELAIEIPIMQAMAFALVKSPLVAALDEVRRLIAKHPALDAQALENAFAEKMRAHQTQARGRRQPQTRDPSVVTSYARRLEKSLGDDPGFVELIAELEADRRLNAGEFKQLAKEFAGRAGKNKLEAIEAIKSRHRNLMDARAKHRFNDGKTAA